VDDAELGSLLRQVVATSDVEVLAEFVERFGEGPIRTLDPAKGWNVVDDPQFLDELIRLGMDVNRPDWFGRTYLHWCAENKEGVTTAGQYLDRGININTIDFMSGTTALGVAAMNGNLEMVKYLLERGADPCLPADHEWAQPKNLADREGHWKSERVIRTNIVLKQLDKDPASLLAPDSTILHQSAHYSEERIVEAMLEAGADIEAEHPSMGGRPLHWATEGNVKICGWLVQRGADVNARVVSDNERDGMTPLIYCAWWCGDDDECIRIAEFLIESGADITARDAEGKSAVDRALQQGHNNLAAALKARGCE
jgi:ankyrin repeat protein